MERMDISSSATKEFFRQAFRNGELVPILGAGFSCGMQARNKSIIPTGNELKKFMIGTIIKEKRGFTEDNLGKQNFSWISERFFRCDMDKIIKYFFEHFTGIKFSGIYKDKFINEIKWPYVYTLNIDTAIENSNDNWEIFYPNYNFIDKSVYNKKKLYKIHGDINHFCKTKDIDDLIFSESQYLQSLQTNSKFHEMLATDCIGKNLLYIGCSLDDEIDIKYSIISDKNRNKDAISAKRIYLTTEDIESDIIKSEKLEDFQITHYIKLDSIKEYELFYEFVFDCYEESLREKNNPNEFYEINTIEMLGNNREENLNFLISSIQSSILVKPFYFFERSEFHMEELNKNMINVFIGRRFSGKTMLAYSMIDYFKDRKKYFIPSNETISDTNLLALINEKNVFITFDTNSITEEQLNLICKAYSQINVKTNIICIFMNSFDEITNLGSYYTDILEEKNLELKGYLTEEENKLVSKKLNSIGLLAFDPKQTILDNSLRIANILNRGYLDEFTISDKKELRLLIWIAVNKKIYLEEILALGLFNDYRNIVKKFSPILEVERNLKGGRYEHSSIKIVCNAPLALLQILNYFAYPAKSDMGGVIKERHFGMICSTIYDIIFAYNRNDSDKVKKFLMFDILNDIFSRQYSSENINKLLDEKERVNRTFGASALIQSIYEYKDIQELKSGEPNYWLQRAKSLYILNMGNSGKVDRLKEGIEWAKIAEGDSEILIKNGQYKYNRTLSNAVIQIAMIYGKLAYKEFYSDKETNTNAIHYYYKGLSDVNNMQAAKSLIGSSRGTKDFTSLLNKIKQNSKLIFSEAIEEAQYLCNIPEYSNGIVFRLG